MTVAAEREPGAVAGARELGLPEPNFRSIFRAGAPRFARELFGPVAGFYLAWKLGGLTAGIVTATVVALAIELYERSSRPPSSSSRASWVSSPTARSSTSRSRSS